MRTRNRIGAAFSNTSRARWPSHVPELLRRLAECDAIEDVFDYFLSEVASDDDFLRSSQPAGNEGLVGVVRAIVKVAIADPEDADWKLFRVPGHRLWHGGLIAAPDVMAQFIYDDASRRLACIAMRLSGGMNHYARVVVPEGDIQWDEVRVLSMSRRMPSAVN